jgi:hypothetical protein
LEKVVEKEVEMRTIEEIIMGVLEKAGPMENRTATGEELVAALGASQEELEALRLAVANSGTRHIYEAPEGMCFMSEGTAERLAELEALVKAQREAEPVGFMNPYGGVLTKLSTGLEKDTFTIPLFTIPPLPVEQAGAVPEGWKLVPIKPTEEMHIAACKVLLRSNGLDGTPKRMIEAMLAAAPQPPKGE